MVRFTLDNVTVPTGPIEWQDMTVLSSFNDEEIGAVVEIDDATFAGDEEKTINEWIEEGRLNGVKGIYQGMPFGIELLDENNAAHVFEGYLNFKEKYNRVHPGKVITKINSNDDILSINERLQSINFGVLLDRGDITPADFIREPYLVEKHEQGTELALISITTFLIIKETIEAVRRLADRVNDVIKAATPNVGLGLTVDVGDVIVAVINAVLEAIYIALMLVQLIRLLRDLLDFIYPPIRHHIGMNFLVMLQKAAQAIGYTLDTGIVELAQITFIPSRPDEKADRSGIPRPEDRGYNCSEVFGIARDLFKAKIATDGNILILRAENDPFWIKESTYQMVDVLHEPREYNTNEVIGNRLYTFETDATDAWTSAEYRGISYSVRVLAKNGANRELINGFRRTDFGVVLGTRKDELTTLEKALKILAQIIDALAHAFGENSNLANRVQLRVGLLKQSARVHSVAKLIRHTPDGKLSLRDDWSAKYLYDNFLNYDSFVQNNFFGQKRMFNEVTIPFCLEDFIKTSKNSYFTTDDGQIGKFVEIKWTFSKDSAVATFWIREVHSTNLIEENVEQE